MYGLWFQGNEYTLLYKGKVPVKSGVENNIAVRFFPGNWYTIDPDTKVENIASRQDLMMALQDINQLLIRFVTINCYIFLTVNKLAPFSVPARHEIWYVLLFCAQDSVLQGWPGNNHNWYQRRLGRPQKQWAKQGSVCGAVYLSHWLQRTVLWGKHQFFVYQTNLYLHSKGTSSWSVHSFLSVVVFK